MPSSQVSDKDAEAFDYTSDHFDDHIIYGGWVDSDTLPGLTIQDHGPVTLPLVDKTEADRLAARCSSELRECSSFDDSSEPSLQNLLQLEASEIAFSNPAWKAGLARLAPVIAEHLAFPGVELVLDLQQLLLFSAGGPSQQLCEFGSVDGQFATLIVQLPSAHNGGHLIVYEDTSPVVHDFGASAGTTQYACHYAVLDVKAESEFTRVTEGVQLLLVYAICWPRGSVQTAYSFEEGIRTAMAARLGQLSDQERRFCYLLDEKCERHDLLRLGPAGIRGIDRHRVLSLCAANDSLPKDRRYAFFIAKADCSDECSWTSSPEFWSRSVIVGRLIKLNGEPVPGTDPLPYFFGDQDVLNPQRVSLASLWHGRRRTAYSQYYNEPELSAKEVRYHKRILIAWPARSVELLQSACRGEMSSNLRLLATKPSLVRLVEQLNHLKTLSKLDRRPFPASLFRQELPTELLSRPFRRELFVLFTELFETAEDLLDGSTGWSDLVSLSQAPKAWKVVEIPILQGFTKDLYTTVRALAISLREDSPAVQSLLVTAVVQGTQPVGARLLESPTQRKVWRVALALPELAVCKRLVERHLECGGAALKSCIVELLKAREEQPEVYAARQGLLKPLFQCRRAWLQGEHAKASQAIEGEEVWRFSSASFQRHLGVQAFLRSAERTAVLRGFSTQRSARKLVKTCVEENTAPSWSPEPSEAFSFTARAGGRGASSYVLLTKTDEYPQRRERKRLEQLEALEQELAKLAPVIAGEGIEAQREPRRADVSTDVKGQHKASGTSNGSPSAESRRSKRVKTA
ncbi:uncharacterized protein PFL1_05986 [Pseudozyma flocculosa PF-1]|uniref:Uncharacterized protein n=2 Tax=Pseudozyma flocculosa TaxID=84751 RepID=A0A5C3F3S2_9BASI|nr:uncharacterized protein PFL1_05986 [Pseudozyma flocculosa PF-1]EPQ26338.1 hypothetical protein PFL1_05986 [Pseudozyma flocculosa PF-1]SPO39078.1 uncharacterized protein PSFLO_04557 [Pseudozyma flocculosa]